MAFKSVLPLVVAAKEFNLSASYLRKLVRLGGVRYITEYSSRQKRVLRYFLYRCDVEDITIRYILLDQSKWLHVAEACQRFELPIRRVNRLATTGKIRMQNVHGKRKILVDDLKEYLKSLE